MTAGRLKRKYFLQALETRYCLTAVAFVEHEIRPSNDDDIYGTSIFAADINGDGRVDIVESTSAAGLLDRIEWIENLGSGNFGDEGKPIASESFSTVHVVDVDSDGDNDIVASRDSTPESVVWFENLDGSGSFGEAILIAPSPSPFATVSDFDGDNDVDVLTQDNRGVLVWYENDGGTFSLAHNIERSEEGSQGSQGSYGALHAADLDSDGDNDFVVTAVRPYRTVWYENLDGEGRFIGRGDLGTHDTVGIGGVTSIETADIDGDGDADVITTTGFGFVASTDGSISWHENQDGVKGFGPSHVIFSKGTNNAVVLDMDGDGDVDVIAHGDIIGTLYFENADGAGSFGSPTVISSRSERFAGVVFPADLDSDGDVDAVSSIRGKLVWYENRLSGDTNDDGEVAFADFLALSANFGKQVDALWEDGDFDSNGIVEFADFLLLAQNFGSKR